MTTNERRAERATVACDAYAEFKNEDPADPTTITDLIVDLLHLADLRGSCPERLLELAKMHYEAEASEEEGVGDA